MALRLKSNYSLTARIIYCCKVLQFVLVAALWCSGNFCSCFRCCFFQFKHSFVARGNVCDLFFRFVYAVACLHAILVFSVSLAAAMSDSTAATSRNKVHSKWNYLWVLQKKLYIYIYILLCTSMWMRGTDNIHFTMLTYRQSLRVFVIR